MKQRDNMKSIVSEENGDYPRVFRKVARWQNLFFYQKADVLYQMTVVFCRRFLPKYGDRTVDQMVQAARSGKQNIVEGSEDGKTSTEMELKLLNVARASIGELRQDYQDYANAHRMELWQKGHQRYEAMLTFCREHNNYLDYEPHVEKWTDEEMCNIVLTLCYQVDSMMNKYLVSLEKEFVTEGGIKERMTAARLGYRASQKERIDVLQKVIDEQRAVIEQLRERVKELEGVIEKNRWNRAE